MNDKTNNAPKGGKQFNPTPYTNLLRSGATDVYFLSAKVCGKYHRESLETTDPKEAQAKRDARLSAIRKAAEAGNDGRGSLTLNEGFEAHLANLEARRELEGKSDEGISPKTLEGYEAAIRKLRENIPSDAINTPLKKVSLDDLKSWVRPIQKTYCATYYNNCVIVLREVFEIGIKKFACLLNHADELKIAASSKKELSLPTQTQLQKLLQNIRDGGEVETSEQKEIIRVILADYRNAKGETDFTAAFKARPDWQQKLGVGPDASDKAWRRVYDLCYYVKHKEGDGNRRAQESADMVEFLAYTGARIEETRQLTWASVDWDRELITFAKGTVKGKTRTKVVPINAALVPVLRRCEARKHAGNKIFGIASCRKAIQSACSRLKIAPLSHHDFRHLFASTLLENGAAPIAVANLLGHSDNGRTLLARYAHADASRSKAVIAGLDFAARKPVAVTKADEIAQLKARLAALEAPANVVALPA